MKELIQAFAKIPGPAGSEAEIVKLVRSKVESLVDETYTDVMGNLYAVKKPQTSASTTVKTVLISAHLDEPGVSIVDIDQNGFLRIAPLGSLKAAELIGQRVKFVRTKISGVIAVEGDIVSDKVEFSNLFIDIAVKNKDEAQKLIQIGDAAAFDYEFQEITPRVLLSHALDNRVSCAVAVDLLENINVPYQLVVVFSTQQQVGSRGIQVAGYRINPDLAIVLDATHAGDTPKSKKPSLKMGGGVAIKALDAGMVVAPALRDHLIALAESEHIPYQIEVSPAARSDASTIQVSRQGVPTCGLSVPMRYLDTPSQMVHMDDVEAMRKLLQAWLENDQLFTHH